MVDANRGWVLTNAHVASHSPAQLTVAFVDQSRAIPAKRLCVDPHLDLTVAQYDPARVGRVVEAPEPSAPRSRRRGAYATDAGNARTIAAVTEKRNWWIHSIWAKELDGDAKLRASDHSWRDPPTQQELATLSDEIARLAEELSLARLEGFIHEALQSRNTARSAPSS